MPKLIIDTIELEVPEGTNVLEAARSIGITIPHFCWHPALGKAGACRVCAVKMLDGPVKGVQMSCMLPAQDGMVVSTTDPEAVAMRRAVIEWLMINHPHDCPVCDEGGECQLQDYTIAGGHGLRRYDGTKRTHTNQYLGERIEHEMNRCIQCYRCVRFYQEYAGGTDFGVSGRAGSVYFGRLEDGSLESPFSGNLVDICPTGVFTDKTARFRARYWDYDMAPSVCPHCSLGCNTVPMARYRELLKCTARRNDQVNGWFICDHGRFSNAAVNAPDRPRQAYVDGNPVDMELAVAALHERLNEFLELNGPESLAIVGSPRMSLEGNIMAARLRQLTGAGTLSYFFDTDQAHNAADAVSTAISGGMASQQDVRSADLVAIMGGDLLERVPMMALAVRQAYRIGARIFVVEDGGQNPSGSNRLFDHTPVASLAQVPLSSSSRPVIITGSLTAVRQQLGSATPDGCRIAAIVTGPNEIGCGLLAREQGATPLSEALAGNRLKGIISFEADLPDTMPADIRVLAAVDWLPTGMMQRAEITLPSTAWVEMDGTFVNYEGRAQKFLRIMEPGLPIRGLNPALHPPRVHRHTAPGGDVMPTWRICAALMSCMGEIAVDNPLSGTSEALQKLDPESTGVVITSVFR